MRLVSRLVYSAFAPQTQLYVRRALATTSSNSLKPVDELIQIDHRSIFELYDRFQLNKGQIGEQQKIANELIREIAIHSAAEELIVYPAIQNTWVKGKEVADHLRADHQEVKEMLYKLDKMSVGDDGYVVKLEKVIQDLRKHTAEEEKQDLVELRARVSAEEMLNLGKKYDRVKAMVPTRPHPSAPDQPPLEAIVGMMQAPIDKLKDTMRDFAERHVSK